MNPFEESPLPEVRPGLDEIIPGATSHRDRYELPIPPELVDDLLRKIDDEEGILEEDDEMPSPPTVH